LKVAISAYPLLYTRSGIGNYSFWLLRELTRVAPDLDLALVGVNVVRPAAWAEVRARLGPLLPAVKVQRTRFPTIVADLLGRWVHNWLEGRAVRRLDPDVLFSPRFVVPYRTDVPTVLMVHDLVYRVRPETVMDEVKVEMERYMPGSLARAAAVIVPSESTRRDLLREYPVPPEKVAVIAEAVGPEFHRIEAGAVRERVRVRWSLPPRYLLAVGTVEPRKNLLALLDLAERLRDRGEELPILVAGGKGWKSAGLHEEHRRRGLEGAVRFLGRVPDEDLPALYSMAEVFLFPSLYEGFGLPLLEAMACGLPVVAARTSSVPEVVGDAAILVDDPHDAAAFETEVLSVLSDPDRREGLQERGRRRAAEFTWERAARETAAVFRRVARERG
jgi:glycosyltransferase involved in cell wall biosynthesis